MGAIMNRGKNAQAGGGAIAATITGIAMVDQTLTAKLPDGVIGTMQFTRTSKGANPVKTNIANAMANAVNSLTYKVTKDDAAFVLACDTSNWVAPSQGVEIPIPPVILFPFITAAPTLSGTPTAGTILSVVPGPYTGTDAKSTTTILMNGLPVGDNYTPTARDLQKTFQGLQVVTNGAGTTAASTTIAECIQDPTLAPAFARTTGGAPTNPYLMSFECIAGFEVKCYMGTMTSGGGRTIAWEVETAVGSGIYAAGTGTVRTTPYNAYKPATAEYATPGRRIRAALTPTGTGSNPQPTFYTDPCPIVAATPRTDKIRSVASNNRMDLFKPLPRPNKVTEALVSIPMMIASGPVDTLYIDVANMLSGPTGGTVGSGFSRTFKGINLVYQGVVVQVLIDGAPVTEAAPFVLTSGTAHKLSAGISTTVFGAGWTSITPGESPLMRFWESFAPLQIVPSCEGDDSFIANSYTTYFDPATDTIVNGVNNTNAGNQFKTSVTGPNAITSTVGPQMRLLGKFASNDPIVIVGVGDSRRGQSAGQSIHVSAYHRNFGKAPVAGLNMALSGSNHQLVTQSDELQDYFQYCPWMVETHGINAMNDDANGGNADGTISGAKLLWSQFRAKAVTGTGVRPQKIFRTSLQFYKRPANGAVLGSGSDEVVAYNNALPQSQPMRPRMDVGGDIEKYFVSAMKAAVAAGEITAYIEYRDRIALSADPNSWLHYRTLQGRYSDGLHAGDARWLGIQEYETVMQYR